jgi:hypothetical protein
MTISYINTGSAPNAGDGDTLRTAFNKINANFGTLYNGAINQLVQSDAPPTPASTTTLWYDTVSGRTYVYYSGSWIDASPSEEGANQDFLTSATIKQYSGYIQEVGLYDSSTGTGSNTVTNVTSLNFDTESAFSLTNMGGGAVLVGMNSTFKYIEIANANTLTAVGLDTLTFVAGNGIELATNDTPGHQSITITSLITPTTSTAGFLYDDGSGHYNWVDPTYSSLENGSYSVTLDGSGILETDSIRTEAENGGIGVDAGGVSRVGLMKYAGQQGALVHTGDVPLRIGQVPPGDIFAGSMNSFTNEIVIDTSSNVYISTGTLFVNSKGIEFGDTTLQTTAWTGTVAYGNVTGIPSLVTPAELTTTNVSTFINDIGYVTSATLGAFITTATINQYVSATSLTNNGHIATLTSAGNLVLPNGLVIDYNTTPTITITGTSGGGLIATDVSTQPLSVSTFNGTSTYTWLFNANGSITWPDGSVQASATTATLAASTLSNFINFGTYTLAVLSNGTVEFPDGSIQTTAYAGASNTATTAISLLNGGTALRPVDVPATLVGSPGDLAGDVAYDGNYLYVCFEDFVQSSYTVTSADTGTNVHYIDILQAGAPTPQIGWEVHDPIHGPLMTITNVSSGLLADVNTPYWRLSESTYANNYIPGLPYILVNPAGAENVWGKLPYVTSANSATSVTKVSSFVLSGQQVVFNNVFAEWSGVGNLLKVGGVNSTFTATYNLSTYYADSINVVNGSNVTFSTTGTALGIVSVNPGDRAEVVLTIPADPSAYRITAISGSTYNSNFISIEQLM